jgi:acyl-CoA dehydrogenase
LSDSDHLFGNLAREIFKDRQTSIPLNVAAEGELDAELWATLTQAGLETALGGDGATLREAAEILYHAGYYAARVPLAEVMLAHWLAACVGWSETTAVPVFSMGRLGPESGLDRERAAGCSTGRAMGVPWGRHATAIYVLIEARVMRIAASPACLEFAANLAGEPRDNISFEASDRTWSELEIEPELVLARAAVLRAALMVGAMERALDLALDHASTRVQFGKPIGRFQAVQQMLAELAAQVAAAAAALELATGHETVFTAAVAKSRVGEAAGLVSEIAHQVIAAMGYTREHPLHQVTRRLWAWRDECGNEIYWNSRLGKAALAAGRNGLWPLLTSAGDQS